ncbi:MAG: HD family hydrolase [Candidatus Thorarchaeota archaeon]
MTIFQFLTTCEKLKRILRTGWLLRGIPPSSAENVSSHSHSTAILAFLLALQIEERVDINRLLLMALIHDLPEAEIGDIPISAQQVDPAFRNAKTRAENQAMLTILDSLPEGLRSQIMNAWTDYSKGKTLEARLVEAADHLSTAIHAAYLVKSGYPSNKFSTFIDHAESTIRELGIPNTEQLITEIRQHLES